MVIHIRQIKKILCALMVLAFFLVIAFRVFSGSSQPFLAGNGQNEGGERFLRPSKQPALKLKYTFSFPDQDVDKPPFIPRGYPQIYSNPGDVVHAYFSILKAAGSVPGSGARGGVTGPQGKRPYPYAYELLSQSTRQRVSPEEFEKLFAGTGHITLLKLVLAHHPEGTPPNIKYYVVEIEVIMERSGKKRKADQQKPDCFAYYYGLVTTECTQEQGWKIKSMEYFPEGFLRVPFHFRYRDGRGFAGTIYKDKYGLVNSIDKVEIEDFLVFVYASGKNKKYRFDFLRLTNGQDILLREFVKDGHIWKEVSLLKKEDQVYKFSVLNPKLREKSIWLIPSAR